MRILKEKICFCGKKVKALKSGQISKTAHFQGFFQKCKIQNVKKYKEIQLFHQFHRVIHKWGVKTGKFFFILGNSYQKLEKPGLFR